MFYSLSAAKTIHGRLAMIVRLDRPLTVVRVASINAPTPGTALAVVVQAGEPPLSVELVRGAPASLIDGGSLL
jgi:hypothetical protein